MKKWAARVNATARLSVSLVALAAGTDTLAPEFNRDIRPILSNRCFTCHGPDPANRKTALRFDTEEGAFAALSGGRHAIVRGDPGRSELWRRVTSENTATRMPPAYLGQEKLSPREIELVRRWIEQGAKWQPHWSFLPVQRPRVPEHKAGDWARSPIDHFVRARLEHEGLKPSPEAGRATLIRRLALGLTGLPPTPAEVAAFVNDPSPDADEKVVDRLLRSPRYGERMAARWLEAARYADTNGYSQDGARSMWRWRDWVIDAFNRNLPFDQFTIEQLAGDLLPNATRDQIIGTAFNRNHRTNGEGGIVDEEFRVEYVADRAETTSTVWLGLTVGCARCHDHKYDPIRQRDYYRLFAYFNNVPEKGLVYNYGNEYPLIQAPTPEHERTLAELNQQVEALRKAYEGTRPELEQAQRRWEKWLRSSGAADCSIREGLVLHYPLDGDLSVSLAGYAGAQAAVAEGEAKPAGEARAASEARQLSYGDGRVRQAASFDGARYVEAPEVAHFSYDTPFTLAAWIYPLAADGAIVSKEYDYPEAEGYGLYLKDGKIWLHFTRRWTDISLRLQTKRPLELSRWHHVAMTYNARRKGEKVRIYANGESQPVEVLFDELVSPVTDKEPFRIGAGGGNRFRGSIDDVRVYNRALAPEEAAVLPVLATAAEIAAKPPSRRSPAEARKLAACFLETASPDRIQTARRDWLRAASRRDEYSESVPTVMVMQEMEKPRDTFILKRGAYDAPGEKVSAGVPAFLPALRKESSGNRLGLARWLVDPSNPLTARVTVNRLWQMLFGAGLVKTVGDFGSQGEWPVHPDLLDWLAAEFVESGWDVKALLKTMVMSSTYRQSSAVTSALLEKDPENRLLARGPRFRLSAEMIRDQALAVSGLLVEKLGGPSVKPYQPPGLWEELAAGIKYERDKGDALYRR
ncbi:MAG: DUF1549 domain-containing protein, partial [Acidobacteria bacterium]|nr:DUF1549 domain-containing protein [Acidobacteriota bacterium]